MAGPNVNCSCFWGNPIMHEDGTCTCPSKEQTPAGTGGIKPGKVPPYPVKTTAPADDGKIFGLSPIVVIGAGLAGLWILSSMDGRK